MRLAPNEVSFANLEGMKEIYQSGGSGYDKTEFYDLFKQYDHRTMFSTLNKNDHAQRKKIFAERYAMTNIMRPDILEGIQKRADSVIEKCRASMSSGSLDVYVVLHCYALDCASHFLFNPGGTDTLNNPSDLPLMQELSYHDSIRQRLVEHYSPRLNSILTLFSPKATPLSKDYVLSQSSHDEKRAPPKETSLIARLQISSLLPIQMAAECMDHMAAGIDTTGDGLCFLMHELSLPRSQQIQSRLREELLSTPTSVPLDRLPYLDAVIKEGLRLFPPIPMSFPRYVPSGGPSGSYRTISGYNIPSHSIVSCQPYSIHLLNSSTWNGDSNEGMAPERFVPERWLDENRAAGMNRLFFSFGTGGRGCVGKNLALTEMKVLMKEVYSRFQTTVADDMTGDMSIDDQIIASRPKDQTCLLRFEAL